MKIDEFLIFEKKFQKKFQKNFRNFFFDTWEDDHVDQKLGYVQRRYLAHFEAIRQGYKICMYVTLEMSRHTNCIFSEFWQIFKKLIF